MPRLESPSWYGERRVLEAGVPTVTVTIVASDAPVVIVGGPGWGAATPLVPELLATANLAVRNDAACPALEIYGSITLAVHGNVFGLGLDDCGIVTLGPGNELTIPMRGARMRYIAVAGGVNLNALSGLRAPLVAGDTILPGSSLGVLTRIPPSVDLRADSVLKLKAAAGRERFGDGALAALAAGPLTVGSADRSTLRLAVAGEHRAAITPKAGASGGPVTPAALVVSPGGEVSVVGPDHPAASAYPTLAEVDLADLPSLWARPVGASVRFSVA